MKIKTILLSLSLVALPLYAADLTRLDTTPGGNKIRIEGDSTFHKWQMEGSLVGGFAEVGSGFPLKPGAEVKPGKVDAKVSVFIPVRSLKSIEKDGKPYKTDMDNIMYEKLLEADHKRITFTLTELTLKETLKTAADAYQFEAKGELVVAGVTNLITMPVMATVLGENKIKFAGSVAAKMTDFKVEPPTKLGVFKTYDEINLFFEWVATKKTAPAAK